MDIEAWLRELGLPQYARAFQDNEIDGEILPRLTAEDLKELGVLAVGHRRRLLDAVGALGAVVSASGTAVATRIESGTAARVERRQLTIMFVDLVGSTALAAALDPEEWRELLRAYQAAVAGEIDRNGGHVAKYLGDGVLAYFGFPQAHEDDAERAIRAALGAVTTTATVAAGDGRPLAARVGVATGVVVVGDLIGEGLRARRP